LTDGGTSKNDWLMQFQADVLDRQVLRSQTAELSGLGAAFAAGLGCGFWRSTDEVAEQRPGSSDDCKNTADRKRRRRAAY